MYTEVLYMFNAVAKFGGICLLSCHFHAPSKTNIISGRFVAATTLDEANIHLHY